MCRPSPVQARGKLWMLAFERVKKLPVRWLSADASFEASLREAPQDEESSLLPSLAHLMLRSASAQPGVSKPWQPIYGTGASASLRGAAYQICWIAESSQLAPRRRTKVHISSASTGARGSPLTSQSGSPGERPTRTT